MYDYNKEIVELLIEITYGSCFEICYERLFLECCYCEDLENMQKILHYIPTFDIHYKNEKIFRNCCELDNIKIAKWLCNIFPNIDIQVKNNYAFQEIFSNSNIEEIKWIWVTTSK